MLSQDANPAEIAGMGYMSRGDDPRKRNWLRCATSEPPMPLVELGNRRAVEERQPMKFRERIRYDIVVPVDFTNPVHRLTRS